MSLIYIDRLIQRSNFLLTELNVHRVVITSVLLAAKFFDDAYYNNAYYAKVGGVLVSEMNGLEVDFLFRINFSLHVTPEVFDKYRAELVMHSQTASFVSSNVTHSPIHASGAHHSPIHASQQLYGQPLQHTSTLQQPLYVPNMNQLHATATYTSIPGHQSVTSAPSCMTAQHHDFRATSQITPSPPAEPEDLYPCDSTSEQLANHGLVAALSAANSFDNFLPVTRAHSLPVINHGLGTNSSAATTTTTTPPFYIPHNCAAQDHSFLAAALEQTQQQQQYVILENQIFPLPTPTMVSGGGHSRSDPTNLGAAVVHGHHHAHLYAQQLVHPLVGARMLTGVSGAGL